MPACTSADSLGQFLVYVSPAVAGLLSATALWVARQGRTTSADALQTSQAAVTLSLMAPESHASSVYPHAAPDPRRSSSTTEDLGSTSTSRGDGGDDLAEAP